MASEEWERDHRERRRKEQGEKLARAERVEVTDENVEMVAKKTGRNLHQLMQLMAECEANGARLHVRLPEE